MSTCFLLTHVPNPRMNKRIGVLKKISATKVICARRASQDIYEPSQDVEHIIFDIDLPSAKHIFKRYIVSQGFQKKAIEKLEEIKPTVIYAESLDSLMIAGKYKRKYRNVKIIFEVADLRENYIEVPKKMRDRIITKALLNREKKAFSDVDCLVVTSPKFYDMHYCDLIPRERMLFIPNAPDIAAFKEYHKKDGGAFTIGFIGGIRYLNQMKMLADVAKELDINVLFAGAGGTSSDYEEIKRHCGAMQNVLFTGKYNYDAEIAKLYGMVDCVFAVYDADNPNVRIALPNKLYESVICELPIIVAKNTYLAELVEEWQIGVAVDHTSADDLKQALERLISDKDWYNYLSSNCRKLRDRILENDIGKSLESFVSK